MKLLSTGLIMLTMATSLSICEAPQLDTYSNNLPSYEVMETQTNKATNPLPPTNVNYKKGVLSWNLPSNNNYTGFEIQVEYVTPKGNKVVKTQKAAKSQVKCTIKSLGYNKITGVSIRTYYNVPTVNGTKVFYSKWISPKNK